MQGTAGIGSSEQYKDGIILSPGGTYDMIKTFEEKSTRFAISVSAGYDYQLTKWLSVCVNYTGWQIGYEYKNSINAKLGIKFYLAKLFLYTRSLWQNNLLEALLF